MIQELSSDGKMGLDFLLREVERRIEEILASKIADFKQQADNLLAEANSRVLDSIGADTSYILKALLEAPDKIRTIATQILEKREAIRQAANALRELETPLHWQAREQGQNEKTREMRFEELVGKDEPICQARSQFAALELQLKGLEADRERLLETSRNARAIVRLITACLGAENGNGRD